MTTKNKEICPLGSKHAIEKIEYRGKTDSWYVVCACGKSEIIASWWLEPPTVFITDWDLLRAGRHSTKWTDLVAAMEKAILAIHGLYH